MKKYLPTFVLGLTALIACLALFIYIDRQPDRTVGDSAGDEKVLAMELSEDGSYYIVTGLGSYDSPEVVIPAEYDGVPVKEIGRWAFREKRDVTAVIIPETVEKICESAFKSTSITEIMIPESVKHIEGYAFADCGRLVSAKMSKNIEDLGNNLFSGCNMLKQITLPENLKNIPSGMFDGCAGLENVEIPEGVEEICEDAFRACRGISELKLPAGLKRIGMRAFRGTRISSIDLPEGLEKIGYCAFMYCPIANISLPDGLREICCDAFSGTELSSIYIPASVERMDADGFGESSGSPFSRCKNLKSVTVDEKNPAYYSQNNCIITREGELLFCISPEDVPEDGSIKSIATFAFSGISADRLVIPEGVVEIKDNGIDDYEHIREIVLPSTLKKLGYHAIGATGAGLEPAERISFSGGKEQWESMERNKEWLWNADKVLIIDLT